MIYDLAVVNGNIFTLILICQFFIMGLKPF
jgi:hypothetical protein